MRTGVPWRALPSEYGPWQTVYGRYRRPQRDGTWSVLLTGLQARADAAGLITWEADVDSTICRARQHAAGARREATLAPSRTITAWGGLAAASPRRCTWPAIKVSVRCPSWSQQVSAATAHSSPLSWTPSECRVSGQAVPVSDLCE
ncbi:transposase [Streptomyces sp. NPDC005374]|uniref:transposase n=1 Tax=Streptomyces sp. NPDC005374 TaxID=3364713 RepID=UPI00367AEDB4